MISIPSDTIWFYPETGEAVSERLPHDKSGDPVIYVRLGVALEMVRHAEKENPSDT